MTSTADSLVNTARDEIAALDVRLLATVNTRIRKVAELRRYKEEHGIAFVDPEREAWLVGYLVLGFPTWMANVLQVTAAAVTLVMVFVIQHTQRRVEIATQLKLDELVRTSDADDRLAAIETEDDDELQRQRQRRA